MAPLNPAENAALFNAIRSGTVAIAEFGRQVMESVIHGLLPPHTDVELALGTTCLRLSAYTRTASDLVQPYQFQSLCASARSIFELCVDVQLLTVPGLLSEPATKFHEFTRLSRFKSAKKMVGFYDSHPQVEDRTGESRRFLATPNLEADIEAAAKRVWGTDRKGKGIRPDHWSGLDLARRAKDCGVLHEEAYCRLIGWLNWYVHSGASGTGGISEEGLRSLELVCRDLTGRFVPEAYRRVGVALHLQYGMPDFAVMLMDLVSRVEVRTFRKFTEAETA